MFFEDELLEFFLQIVIGFIAFRYTEKFLVANFDNRKKILIVWIFIYAVAHIFLSKITENFSPHNRFIILIPHILIFYALQKKFFVDDKAKQIFVIASFTAGWEILRFAVSPLSHAIFSVWSPAWAWFVNFLTEKNIFDAEEIISVMTIVKRAVIFFVIFFCRGVQLAIFIFYLRTISKKFLQKNYDLKFYDSLFLIFPCVTVLLIDFTVRLMAFSADNGAMLLIYERVPETVLLLPIVSLLLLGVIISSVILFENFVRYKEEEQKRLLLENRVVEVHREISELQEIYSEIRGLKHDLRNHLENIFAYVRKNSVQSAELENYLQSMTATVEKLNFADKTGNAITDIILHRTRQICAKKNILFTANFICPKKFDIYDISIILNNALQNAVEATEKISGKIEIKSYERGGLFFIEVENNFVGEVNFSENNLPVTTKIEKNLHGIGLENILSRSKKYSGDIDIKIENNIFKLTVMLYKKLAE